MLKEIVLKRTKDWSLSLEDDYYIHHRQEMIAESLEAIQATASGCYVNLVTHGDCGHPDKEFIPELIQRTLQEDIAIKCIQYIDECGCGGHVTRVYR